jgi:hypothetical protein
VVDSTQAVVGLTLGIIALGGVLSRWYFKKLRPALHERERDRIAQRDVLVGRPAVPDSIVPGKFIAPALPGIGQRMDTIEAAVAELARSNQRHEAHEAHLARHDREIADLAASAMERIVGKVESVAAWQAVEAVAKNPDSNQP